MKRRDFMGLIGALPLVGAMMKVKVPPEIPDGWSTSSEDLAKAMKLKEPQAVWHEEDELFTPNWDAFEGYLNELRKCDMCGEQMDGRKPDLSKCEVWMTCPVCGYKKFYRFS